MFVIPIRAWLEGGNCKKWGLFVVLEGKFLKS